MRHHFTKGADWFSRRDFVSIAFPMKTIQIPRLVMPTVVIAISETGFDIPLPLHVYYG